MYPDNIMVSTLYILTTATDVRLSDNSYQSGSFIQDNTLPAI
jgi:hypothetical protein